MWRKLGYLFWLGMGMLSISTLVCDGQNTAFNYQGRLQCDGLPANGTYNFQFSLFSTNIDGVAVAGPVCTTGVGVTNGLFTVSLDFGPCPWNCTNWLEICVESNGSSSATTLAPRQLIAPVPNAMYAYSAGNLTGVIAATNLPPNLTVSGSITAGSFSGNGSELTNLNAAAIAGIVTNGGAFTGDGAALTNLNAVTNTSDAVAAMYEYKNLGVGSNLVDFVSFCSGEGMTSQTYMGKPLTITNVSWTPRGAHFNGNSSIGFNCGMSPTNTIVIVWGPDHTNTLAQYGNLFQAANTNTWDSESMSFQGGTGIDEGHTVLWMNNKTTPYPTTLAGYTNLLQFYWNAGYTYAWDIQIRHVTVISHDGHGNVLAWDNGIPCDWYLSGQPQQTFPSYPQSTLNYFQVGLPCATSGMPTQVTNGFAGYVESVQLFNGVASPQLIQAATYASDWIQPFAEKRYWITDSLGAGNSLTNNLETMADSFLGNEAIIFQYMQGGTKMIQYGNLTNSINFNGPHGKIKTVRLEIAAGINDIDANGTTGPQLFAEMTNLFLPYALQPGFELNLWDINQTWTNSDIYPQTADKWGRIATYDQLLTQNHSFIRNVYSRSSLVTQDMLNTNRVPRLSVDGVHFNDPTNGDSAYQMIAALVIPGWLNNPYQIEGITTPTVLNALTLTNLNWTNSLGIASGIFSGDGSGLTNITTSSITGLGNLAVLNGISSNNVSGQINFSQIYGDDTTNTVQFTNGANQWLSGNLQATGNVSAVGRFYGNGAGITNIAVNYQTSIVAGALMANNTTRVLHYTIPVVLTNAAVVGTNLIGLKVWIGASPGMVVAEIGGVTGPNTVAGPQWGTLSGDIPSGAICAVTNLSILGRGETNRIDFGPEITNSVTAY